MPEPVTPRDLWVDDVEQGRPGEPAVDMMPSAALRKSRGCESLPDDGEDAELRRFGGDIDGRGCGLCFFCS